MASATTALAEAANAQLGINLPLWYGPVRLTGDNIFLQTQPNGNRLAIYILGEGEMGGVVNLWINKKAVGIDTSVWHFHPGIDGVLGHGLTPESTGGDNLVDSFWSLVPTNYQPLTFSRKAYLFLNVPPDPGAPSSSLDVVGDYLGVKVRSFDASGNQFAYQYSTNGAWQLLDLILRRHLKRYWSPSEAAAAGGDLTAAEKARIDFPSVSDSATWCNTALAGGQSRFNSGVGFTQATALRDAVAQMCMISQLFVHEAGGKIYIRADKPRASSFTLTSDHVKPGTLNPSKKTLKGAANRAIITFRDTNPQEIVDIETTANSGLVRSANVVTIKFKTAHPFLIGDNVQVVNPDDASFALQNAVASVPSSTTLTVAQAGANATSGGGFVGTIESRFAVRTYTADHNQHQIYTGQRGLGLTPVQIATPVNYDFGSCTMEQVQRAATFQKQRSLGMDQSPYTAPAEVDIDAYMYAVDSQNRALASMLQGDVLTIDKSVSEEFQGDYEISRMGWNWPVSDAGSGQQSNQVEALIKLELLQMVNAAFSDTSISAQAVRTGITRRDLPPGLITDNLCRNGDFALGTANWGKGIADQGFSSAQFLSGITGMPRGSAEVLVPSNLTNVSIESQEYIPIDPTRTYLIRIWIKIGVPLSGGIACYAGFAEYDASRNRVQHDAGGNGVQQLPTQVNLAAAFNANAFFTDGTTFSSGGGLTLSGSAISSNLLGASLTFNGVLFTFGAANVLNGVRGNVGTGAVTITLPAGQYSSVRIIVACWGGNKTAEPWKINYTDGTFTSVSLNMSDWVAYTLGTGGSLVRAMAYLDLSTGATQAQAQPVGVFHYQINLDPTKTVSNMVVAGDNGVVVLAVTMVPPDIIATPLFDGLLSTTSNGWQEFRAEVTGTGGTGPGPTQFNQATAFVRLAALLNWGAAGTAQQIEIGGIRFSEVDAGAVRAIGGLDINSRLTGTFRNNPVNTNGTLTGSNPLSQSGTSTKINVSSFVLQFGDGQVGYNAGSVDPGSYGTWAVYCIDPAFNGGAVVYGATQSTHIKTSNNSIIIVGTITTSGGGGANGAGGGAGAGDGYGGLIQLPSR